MISLESYALLEEKGVFIHYGPEHYSNGSNICFSIEFILDRKAFTKKIGKKPIDELGKEKLTREQTGWYNDNHDFGNATQTMVASIKLAFWYLEDPTRILLINSGYNDPEYQIYQEEKSKFLDTIMIKS
jgi:hypothetical protein